MQLLLIRHAIAEEKEDFARTGRDDDERPLTSEGRKKMRQVAAGLRRIVDTIDVLASSPFVRAMQTAEIVAAAYEGMPIVAVPALTPDAAFDEFAAWLREQHDAKIIAAVGHEPHIGGLATWLLCGDDDSRTPFRKGGAALLDIDGRPGRASAALSWFLPPGVLRRLD